MPNKPNNLYCEPSPPEHATSADSSPTHCRGPLCQSAAAGERLEHQPGPPQRQGARQLAVAVGPQHQARQRGPPPGTRQLAAHPRHYCPRGRLASPTDRRQHPHRRPRHSTMNLEDLLALLEPTRVQAGADTQSREREIERERGKERESEREAERE